MSRFFDFTNGLRLQCNNQPVPVCDKCGASCKWGACIDCNHKPDKPHESTLVRVFSGCGGRCKVSIYEEFDYGRIVVGKQVTIGDGTCKAATVNWSACGSQVAPVCREFLRNLRQAIERAEELDSKYPVGSKGKGGAK